MVRYRSNVTKLLALLVIILIFMCLWPKSELNPMALADDERIWMHKLFQNRTLHRFVSQLEHSRVDLLILMERSKAVGRYNFYTKSRKLVKHVLRYYSMVDPNYVQVTLATFAADFKIHFDGMSGNLTKHDIWRKYWQTVALDDGVQNWSPTNLELVVQETQAVFDRFHRADATRYIWVLGQEEIGAQVSQRVSNIIKKSFTTVITSVTGLRIDEERAQTAKVWTSWGVKEAVMVLNTIKPLPRLSHLRQISDTQFSDGHGNILGTCTDCVSGRSCASGSKDCVCTTYNIPYACPKPDPTDPHNGYCAWDSGLYGAHCEYREKQCLPGACANSGKCVPHVGGYSCKCRLGFDAATECDTRGVVSVLRWLSGAVPIALISLLSISTTTLLTLMIVFTMVKFYKETPVSWNLVILELYLGLFCVCVIGATFFAWYCSLHLIGSYL